MPGPWRPSKIVSGGQTGADRAALDAALALGIPHGGWVPLGRRAEDGRIPDRYKLRETDSADYAVRTEKNVQDSDATLVVTRGPAERGSALTLGMARKHAKPCLHLDLLELDEEAAVSKLRRWLDEVRPATLNVAGPRASTDPAVYPAVRTLLRAALG